MEQEHYDILMKGVKVWNQWRVDSPETIPDLQGANLQGVNLQGANLQGVNLQNAKLQNADLRGADLDFSCWPLWCGSIGVKMDDRLNAQMLYHAFINSSIKPTEEQREFINKNFHCVIGGTVKPL